MEKIFTTHIDEMNTMGNGIAKVDGCVIFCIGAVDGDTVTAEITEEKKNYKIAKVVSVDTPSSHRCEANCPSYGSCGGCSLRHITYEHETEIKLISLKNALRRAGFGDVDISEITVGEPERYRNKAVFRFDGTSFGYMQEKSRNFTEVEDCLLCPNAFSKIASFAAKYFEAMPLNYLFLRQNHDGSQITCVIGRKEEHIQEIHLSFAKELEEKFPQVVGTLSKYGTNPEDGKEAELIWGQDCLEEGFLGLDLLVSPDSFFQVNHGVAEKLCKKAAFYACGGANAFGADLYCGTGIIGLSIAKLCPDAYITGVEINECAVEDAKENAERNGLTNIGFFCGDSADFAKSIYGSIDFITIDPPRAGCSDKMIKELLRIAPERLVYVSCDPSTLGRDLAKLCEKKYKLMEVSAFDLFPRTKHLESICLLCRQK